MEKRKVNFSSNKKNRVLIFAFLCLADVVFAQDSKIEIPTFNDQYSSGWHVTQIEEEYFNLNMIGAQLKTQSISSGGKNACDKMLVKTEDGDATYYFEANKVFEMEARRFGK